MTSCDRQWHSSRSSRKNSHWTAKLVRWWLYIAHGYEVLRRFGQCSRQCSNPSSSKDDSFLHRNSWSAYLHAFYLFAGCFSLSSGFTGCCYHGSCSWVGQVHFSTSKIWKSLKHLTTRVRNWTLESCASSWAITSFQDSGDANAFSFQKHKWEDLNPSWKELPRAF